MNIKIDKKLPLSIKDQLKKQIIGMVQSGLLKPGQPLPSCKDLSLIVSVNKNTIASAFSELCTESVLISKRGAGTQVNPNVVLKIDKQLKSLIDKTFKDARRLGYSQNEVTNQFFSSLVEQPDDKKYKILLIWANRITMNELAEKLESTLNVSTESLLVQDFRNDSEVARSILADVDMVLTSLNYIEDILPIADEKNVKVLGILLTPASLILNEVVRLPHGSTVGFTCVNNIAAETTCKDVHLSGNITFNTIWAGTDDPIKLSDMIARCDIVFATHLVYDRVVNIAGPQKNYC
jgi:GntR family transcriptional regulator